MEERVGISEQNKSTPSRREFLLALGIIGGGILGYNLIPSDREKRKGIKTEGLRPAPSPVPKLEVMKPVKLTSTPKPER